MKILAADDEVLALELLKNSIQRVAPDAELVAFSKTSELVKFAENNTCDIAFLDINMAGITGIELARKLKETVPNINIIFVTGYSDFTAEAMAMHASGYIMKPVTPDKVKRELEDLRYPIPDKVLMKVQCFGNFDVFTTDGKPIKFARSKSKELLAILVSKKGSSCTIKELTSILFENSEDDEKKKDYTQQLISTLIKTLRGLGIDKVINKSYNSISINTDLIECDYYKFNEKDPNSLVGYSGEFMAQYSWAEYVSGYLEHLVRNSN